MHSQLWVLRDGPVLHQPNWCPFQAESAISPLASRAVPAEHQGGFANGLLLLHPALLICRAALHGISSQVALRVWTMLMM